MAFEQFMEFVSNASIEELTTFLKSHGVKFTDNQETYHIKQLSETVLVDLSVEFKSGKHLLVYECELSTVSPNIYNSGIFSYQKYTQPSFALNSEFVEAA